MVSRSPCLNGPFAFHIRPPLSFTPLHFFIKGWWKYYKLYVICSLYGNRLTICYLIEGYSTHCIYCLFYEDIGSALWDYKGIYKRGYGFLKQVSFIYPLK